MIDSSVVMQAIVNGLLIGSVYGLVAIGLTMIFGVMEIVNFAQGALMMLGMYITYWLFHYLLLSPYLSVFVVGPALFFVGALLQRFLIDRILKAPVSAQLLLTLGVMIVMESGALMAWGTDYYSLNIESRNISYHIKEIMINFSLLMAFICAICITAVLYYFLRFTELGMIVRACSDNKRGALISGIDVKRFYYIAFGIGAACTGIAGAVITPFTYVYPTVGLSYLIIAFIIVVLGGMGNFFGAFWAGLIIGVAESIGSLFMPGSLKEVLSYGIFLIVLFVKPTGLFGSLRRVD